MELVPTRKLHLLAGRANRPLAESVASHLGVELDEPNLVDFASGEIRCRFDKSVRGADVFIIQTHAQSPEISVNDAIMEQLIMIDAAKRASAKRITAVIPYLGYSRQDRKSKGREPISARMVCDMFSAAGTDRLISVDLHSGQIMGFFDGPFDHLTCMPVLLDHLRKTIRGEFVIVAPDTGRTKVAEQAANRLGVPAASVYKVRDKDRPNQAAALGVMGEEVIGGRTCVLIDDMIDTAGTMCAAADALLQKGATEVWAAATHPVLSDPATERLRNAPIAKVVVTDTLPIPPAHMLEKLEIVSAAKIIADAIDAVFEDTSVSELFDGANAS